MGGQLEEVDRINSVREEGRGGTRVVSASSRWESYPSTDRFPIVLGAYGDIAVGAVGSKPRGGPVTSLPEQSSAIGKNGAVEGRRL